MLLLNHCYIQPFGYNLIDFFIIQSAQFMRQTSLLDSFIKRQKKQEEDLINQGHKQQHIGDDQNLLKQNKQNLKSGKKDMDSDEEQESQNFQDVQKQIQDMDFNQQSSGLIVKKKKGKRSKSQNKQRVYKSAGNNRKTQIIKQTAKQDNQFAHFTDATPIWAQKQYCLDKNKRNALDPQYDHTTLYVPDQAWSKFTAPMKQFWKIKSQNFDKIVFFKLGKFYQLFYDDAAIGNKYLDLKFMGTKMHTGFPQKCLQKYADQLVELGFKVVIVEQMQTPDQMQQRIKEEKKHGRKSQKTLNREITQIFTKGTYVNRVQKQEVYWPNYLISLRVFHEAYAFSLLQIGTNQILMGIVDSVDKLKTVLYQTRPVQLAYDPDNLNNDLVKMMEKTFLHMQLSKVVGKNNVWHPLNSISQLETLEKQGRIKKSKIFQIINGFSDINKNLLYSTLSGLFAYLKSVFKFQYVIETIRFNFYQKDSQTKNMILDSQALQHLQIFQTSEGSQQSLFNKIDRTKTKFGKRLLRKWLMCPLNNKFHIDQRLNAVEDLSQISQQRQKASQILKNLPDLDKKINKLYHYAIKTTSASKAIYFQDLNTSRLKQFRQVMQKLQEAVTAMSIIGKCRKKFKSSRLKQLITLAVQNTINNDEVYAQNEDDQSCHIGLLPNITSHLDQFKSFVKWQGNIPIPQKGLVTYFDQLQKNVQQIKSQLQKYIDKIRYEMNQPNLKFAHTKQRYQIQIPQRSDKRKPKIFQFTSKKAGYSRYISPVTKQLVKKLQKVQEEVKQQMGLFVGFFFQEFKKKHKIWQRFIDVVAQIDCLISLTEYSVLGEKVRPQFVENQFQIKAARHPCLTNIQFIPNDINLKRKVMLLTGPNMGGKSTVLRTACTLAVLAQVGCYVPAQSYTCQIIDRIFTRIGASDKLQLGKSTFFIQMQQTKNIVLHSTNKSLAIIDQLGRGTSTFDGLAIAYSVLKNITQQIKCYCIFATHYHILIQEFKQNKDIKLMMMDSIVKQHQIIFLYKLVPGHVQKSFGLSVASKVGIQKGVVEIAERQAEKMNRYMEGKRKKILGVVWKFLKDKD